MPTIKLKIAELRKEKGIGQQDLANVLGVSFQAVSKWENGVTMPDITLLPEIAGYFQVSVDELLGLKPLHREEYIKIDTDNHDTSNGKENNVYKNRKYFWNNDYLAFLLTKVLKIEKPTDVIEFRCCEGYLGQQLLELLPEESKYTGVDNKYFTDRARTIFSKEGYEAEFTESDIYSFKANKGYDMAIIQAGLRHMNKPLEVLKIMTASVKKGGLVVCIDVNREFENDGLYMDNLDYDYLCTAFDFHKVWKREREQEGRDYAIGMRLPFYMQQVGLRNIDVRLNDKVQFVHPGMPGYEQTIRDFIEIHGWNKDLNLSDKEKKIEYFMNRGIDRAQAEAYIKRQQSITEYFNKPECDKSFLHVQGLLIAYGTK